MPRYGKAWIAPFVKDEPMTAAQQAAAISQLGLLVDVLEERAAAPAPVPPPVVRPSIFQQPGWFAVRYDALPNPEQLVAAGVKWVIAVLSHGVNSDGSHNNDADDRTNQAWLAAGKAAPYRNAGIKVGGWGWQERIPETEAVIAATHIRSFKLDLWIANGEANWKPDDPRHVPNGPDRFAAALEAELRTLGLPSLPVAWSVLGAAVPPNVFPYHYAAFTSRGWHVLPQAYPQESPEYQLGTCVDHAVKALVDLQYVHPTIANYPPKKADAFRPTVGEWVGELRAARARGVVGFSVWAHDFTAADVRTISQAVAA